MCFFVFLLFSKFVNIDLSILISKHCMIISMTIFNNIEYFYIFSTFNVPHTLLLIVFVLKVAWPHFYNFVFRWPSKVIIYLVFRLGFELTMHCMFWVLWIVGANFTKLFTILYFYYVMVHRSY